MPNQNFRNTLLNSLINNDQNEKNNKYISLMQASEEKKAALELHTALRNSTGQGTTGYPYTPVPGHLNSEVQQQGNSIEGYDPLNPVPVGTSIIPPLPTNVRPAPESQTNFWQDKGLIPDNLGRYIAKPETPQEAPYLRGTQTKPESPRNELLHLLDALGGVQNIETPAETLKKRLAAAEQGYEKARINEQRKKESLAGQWGLDPTSTIGGLVNTAGHLVDGYNRFKVDQGWVEDTRPEIPFANDTERKEYEEILSLAKTDKERKDIEEFFRVLTDTSRPTRYGYRPEQIYTNEDGAPVHSIVADGIMRGAFGVIDALLHVPEGIRIAVDGLAAAADRVGEAIGLPDWLLERKYVGISDTLRPFAEGFSIAGTDVPGLNTVSEVVRNAQRIFENPVTEKEILLLQAKAATALESALEGNYDPIVDVLSDPKAWAYLTGEAAPSLVVGIVGGLRATAAMSFGGASGEAIDIENLSEEQLDPMRKALAVAIATGYEIILERLGIAGVLGKLGKKNLTEIANRVEKGLLSRILVGGGVEGATEASQAIASNVAFQQIDPDRKLTDGVLEGFMGGTGSGGAAAGFTSVVDGARLARQKAAEQSAKNRQARAMREQFGEGGTENISAPLTEHDLAVYEQAVKANDSSIYTQKGPDYNPIRAAGVHYDYARRNATTGAKKEAEEKVGSILNSLQKEVEEQEAFQKEFSEAKVKELTETNKELQEIVSQLPENHANLETYQNLIKKNEDRIKEINTYLESNVRREHLNELRKLRQQVKGVENVRNSIQNIGKQATEQAEQVDQMVAQANAPITPEKAEEAKAAADEIVIMAMRSPERVSDAQIDTLISNPNNALTENQRTYLRRLKETRVLENEAKSLKDVSEEVFKGDLKTNQVGIAQYRSRIAHAIEAGDIQSAERHLRDLTHFTYLHRGKAATIQEALERSFNTGEEVGIARSEDGVWQILDHPLTKDDRRKYGGINVQAGKTNNLVSAVQLEADALTAAHQELTAAVNMLREGIRQRQTPTTPQSQSQRTPQYSTERPEVSSEESSTIQSNEHTAPTVASAPLTPQRSNPTPTGRGQANTQTQTELQLDEINRIAREAGEEAVIAADFDNVPRGTRAAKKATKKASKQAVARQTHQEKGALFGPEEGATTTPTPSPVTPTKTATKQARVLEEGAVLAEEQSVTGNAETVPSQDTTTAIETTSPQEGAVTNTVTTKAPTGGATTETTPTERQSGKLSAIEKTTPAGTEFTSKEFGDFFTQSEKGARDSTSRPLVAVKDFISGLMDGSVGITEFLGELSTPLTDAQLRQLRGFVRVANRWNKLIQDDLVPVREKYRYTNPITYLINQDENGLSLDENVTTAISYGGYSWVAENYGNNGKNSPDEVKRLLGRSEDSHVTYNELKAFVDIGTEQGALAHTIGQRVVKALGIRATDDTPKEMLPKLQVSLGLAAIKAMLKDGVIVRQTLTEDQKRLFFGENSQNNYANPVFYKVANGGLAKEIADTSRNTDEILDRLITTERLITTPSFEPNTYKQTYAQNSTMFVPEELGEIVDKNKKAARYIRKDLWGVLSGLSEDIQKAIAGYNFRDPKFIHASLRDKVAAKNLGIERELQRITEFVDNQVIPSEKGLDQEFFLDFSVYLQQRVGIATQAVNPQHYLSHRYLVYSKDWETEIAFDNPTQLDNFLLRVAEGFGEATDKRQGEKVLANLEPIVSAIDDYTYVTEDTLPVVNAVNALRRRHYEGVEFSEADQQAIAQAVDIGGEGFKTLDALMALAHYSQAKRTGQSSFSTTIMAEVDGVNNGPILASILLGAAYSSEGMESVLAQGGIYTTNSEHVNFNIWKDETKKLDMYEQTMADLGQLALEHARKADPTYAAGLEAIYNITGPLVDTSDSVTKEGRNFTKNVVTPTFFGASASKATERTAASFVDTISKRIEDIYLRYTQDGNPRKDEVKRLIRDINTILAAAKVKFTPIKNMHIEQLMERPFKDFEVKTLLRGFRNILGDPISSAISSNFNVYLERNQVNTNTAALIYTLHDSVKKVVVEDLVKDKPHGITPKQEAEIDYTLQAFSPFLHTQFSKESDNLEAGLHVARSTQRRSYARHYEVEAKFKTPFTGAKNKSTRAGAREIVQEAPGVAMGPLSTHSTDSYISHKVQALYDVLNNHDSLATGVGKIEEVTKELNKQTWKAMLEYSPAREMYEALSRSVVGLYEYLERHSYDARILDGIAQGIAELAQAKAEREDNPAPRLDNFLSSSLAEAFFNARIADTTKLGSMATWTSVNQYALEGGEYRVTDEDRAEAAKRQAEVPSEIPEGVLQKVKALETLLAPHLNKIKEDPSEVTQSALTDEFEKVTPAIYGFTPSRVMQLLDHGKKDESLSPELRSDLGNILQTMITEKVSYKDAVHEVVDKESVASINELLYKRYREIPENQWGDRGTPVTRSDPYWVNIFEQRPNLTAKQAIHLIRQRLRQGTEESKDLRHFHTRVLSVLEKLVSPDLTVRYVTPATAPEQVMGAPADNARGWYTYKGGMEHIYVLSPDYVHSGLTTEVLLHELIHSTLAHVTKTDNSPEVKQIVQELNDLRSIAQDYVTKNNLEGYEAALANVDEFIAWGMTNLDFQQKVLSKVSIESKTSSNPLISGMRAFIKNITSLFFKGTPFNKKGEMVNGMAALIANVSGLFNYTAQNAPSKVAQTLNQENTSRMDEVKTLSTTELFDALDDAPINSIFQKQLRGLLEGIVAKVHGPFGSFMAEVRNSGGETLSAVDAFQKALDTGKAPFASKTIASGFQIRSQESYVMDQVEATVRTVLGEKSTTTAPAYRELNRLYEDMRKRLSAKDFYQGDWDKATKTEKEHAQAKYDFLFKLEEGPDGRLDYLSRFAAMGLAHEETNRIFSQATFTPEQRPEATSFIQRLRNIFLDILEILTFKRLGVTPGESTDKVLTTLVDRLVDIESSRRASLGKDTPMVIQKLEDLSESVSSGIREQISKASSSKIFRESKSGYIQAVGKITNLAANNRMGAFAEGFLRVRGQLVKERAGIVTNTISYVRGAPRVFQAMLQGTKLIERTRQSLIHDTARFVLESFAENGAYLTNSHKKAVTDYFLRTKAHVLLKEYTTAEIADIIQNEQTLNNAITQKEQQLQNSPHYAHYIQQSRALAYFMATGKSTVENLALNTMNIVNMVGTPYHGKVSKDHAENTVELLDSLVTLYAIKYSPKEHMDALNDVISRELNRGAEGNGIEFILLQHQMLQQEAKELLFDGSEALMMQGYIPEIYNPRNTLVVATPEEGKIYEDMRFVNAGRLGKDALDPNKTEHNIYMIRDGGNLGYVSQIFSLTEMSARGTPSHYGHDTPGAFSATGSLTELERIRAAKTQRAAKADASFDPLQVSNTYMVPTVNANGEIVGYRYMMQNSTKDALLERENRFEVLLGTFAGNTFDKVESKEQNRKAVQLLRDIFENEYGMKSEQFLEVGPNSQSKEMREIWRMLPEHTKQATREIWGRQPMMIRADLVDIFFGYRKKSLSSIFNLPEHERNLVANAFVKVMETSLTHYAKLFLGAEGSAAENYGKKAGILMRRGEDAWQEIVRETKDIIVVKSGIVLMANIWSNFTVLLMYGVSISDMVRDHIMAYRATAQLKEDLTSLHRVQTLLNTGYGGQSKAELERQEQQLQHALQQNPVYDLYSAGLMPTIVDDIAMLDDPYSYKSRLTRKVERGMEKLPSIVQKGLRSAYMTKDTAMYQFLYEATQMSDFVARVVLHKHLTTRKRNPLSDTEAKHRATEAFVNYDIALPRGIQYLDDMGILPFMKYFLSIQRVLMTLAKEHPGRVALTLLGNNALDVFPTVMDTSILTRLGNNPLYTGALRFPGLLGELPTVQGALSLIR